MLANFRGLANPQEMLDRARGSRCERRGVGGGEWKGWGKIVGGGDAESRFAGSRHDDYQASE